MNVIAFQKNESDPPQFVFLWDDESRGETIRQMGLMACDKELEFSWQDAVTQRVNALMEREPA